MRILNTTKDPIGYARKMKCGLGRSPIGAEIMARVLPPLPLPQLFLWNTVNKQISNIHRLRIKTASRRVFPNARVGKRFISYLVNFVPICCLSSSLSSSVCMGRMFFSSSSRLEGLLLSLIAKESFLQTFLAKEPVGERRGSAKGGVIISLQQAAGKEVPAKEDTRLSFTLVRAVGKGGVSQPHVLD